MTITKYFPQWLRRGWKKPAPAAARVLSKKDRQILPTVQHNGRPIGRLQDDDSPAGYRVLWRH